MNLCNLPIIGRVWVMLINVQYGGRGQSVRLPQLAFLMQMMLETRA